MYAFGATLGKLSNMIVPTFWYEFVSNSHSQNPLPLDTELSVPSIRHLGNGPLAWLCAGATQGAGPCGASGTAHPHGGATNAGLVVPSLHAASLERLPKLWRALSPTCAQLQQCRAADGAQSAAATRAHQSG